MTEDTLLAGSALSALGGLLTIVVGGVFLSESAIDPSGILQSVGVLALIAGLLLMVLGIGLSVSPEHHTGVGVVIASISSLLLFGGSLFIPGAVLCITGAILGILHEDWEEQLQERLRMGPTDRTRSATSGGAPGIYTNCPVCGKVVGPGAPACPHCGVWLRGGSALLRDPHNCPECGGPIGSNAKACPHCGTPLAPHNP